MSPDLEGIDRVAVLGAGSMGHGIAEVVAMGGYDVTMRDIERDLVEEGYENIRWSLEKLEENGRLDEDAETVLERVSTAVDLEEATRDADLVIEAVPERMDLKKETFAEVEGYTHDDAILASNTSSLSITEMATATEHPERVCGMHFFNPPVKMDLVEVIHGAETSDETAEAAYAFVESIDKTPIHVRKDVTGFVVNGVLFPFMIEPAWMLSNGEATIREADAAMVHQRGYPMGPFELTDLTGIDVNVHIRQEAGLPVPPVLEEKEEAGKLGKKSGEGFYDYEDGDGADYEPEDGEGFDTFRVEAMIVNEAARIVGEDVATAEAVDTGMRLGTGFPEGPCRRGDKMGLDRVLEKLHELHEEYGEDRYVPHPYLVELVESGKTGEDAGEGFYEYGGESGERDYQTINHSLSEDGLLAVELDRPERLNALNQDLMDEIVHLLEHVDTDEVRAVTFEGAGDRAFCAGADITGFSGMDPANVDVTPVFETVAEFPRPTLAKIQGFCLGGGLELAMACDLRIATEDSEFGFPEINLGLLPGGGGTQRSMRMLTEARAKELVFRGEHVDAERAEEWGLINRAVDADGFEGTVDEFLDDLVNGPPIALRMAKEVMNEGADENIDAGLRMESQAFGLLLTTDDMMEGASAFMEDRDPEFEGK